MKKTILKATLFFALSLTYSCETKNADQAIKAATENTPNTDSIKAPSSLLNEDKLWTANPETTAGVEAMISLMNGFTGKEDIAAFAKLTSDLKSEFAMIFKKCTMTGEAHEQLHHFLIPIQKELKTLGSSDLEKCQESFSILNTHLATYKNIFQ